LSVAQLDQAIAAIEEAGPTGSAIESVSPPVNPSYLLTMLASDGYAGLADCLNIAERSGGGVFNLLLAFAQFAIDYWPYFEVMARPPLYDQSDPLLRTAQSEVIFTLRRGTPASLPPAARDAVAGAAWSFMQSFASLWACGCFDRLLECEATVSEVALSMACLGSYEALRAGLPALPAPHTVAGAMDTWGMLAGRLVSDDD
jgi:hypothetical protein